MWKIHFLLLSNSKFFNRISGKKMFLSVSSSNINNNDLSLDLVFLLNFHLFIFKVFWQRHRFFSVPNFLNQSPIFICTIFTPISPCPQNQCNLIPTLQHPREEAIGRVLRNWSRPWLISQLWSIHDSSTIHCHPSHYLETLL